MLLLGPGLLTTYGPHHKKQRKMLNPVFSVAHMRNLTPLFYDITGRVSHCLWELRLVRLTHALLCSSGLPSRRGLKTVRKSLTSSAGWGALPSNSLDRAGSATLLTPLSRNVAMSIPKL